MKTMHILIGEQNGGAETFFMRLGNALNKHHAQHMIISPHAEREKYFIKHAVPYTVIDFEGIWQGLRGRLKLNKLIHTEQPDVVVAWMNRAARRLTRGPHTNVGRLGGAYKLKNYSACDFLVANSPDLVSHACKTWPKERVRLISNFAELNHHSDPTDRSQWDTPADAPLLFTCGRLHPQKGFDTLLDALPNIPDTYLWIAGDGEERSRLEMKAKKNKVSNRIRFLGWQSDMSPFLKASDIFVFPSRYEGTSNALLEACVAAKPIITTNGHSVSWFLEHEKNALIIPVDDSHKLAASINRLNATPKLAAKLAANASDLYTSKFSEKAVCNDWLCFLKAISKTDK